MITFTPGVALKIRGSDTWASQGGAYQAARSTSGRSRLHEGIDLVMSPGQVLLAPEDCEFVRIADPYLDKRDSVLSGFVLRMHGGLRIKVLYCLPSTALAVDTPIHAGDLIAVTQSMQHLYPGITDHIHVEHFDSKGSRLNPTDQYISRVEIA